MKYIIILMMICLSGCGSGGSGTTPSAAPIYVGDVGVTNTSGLKDKPMYEVEFDLGLYVGYQETSLVTSDGRLHDKVYNIFTSAIQQGCYLRYKPEDKYDTRYHVRMKRWYRDGVPVNQEAIVWIGITFDKLAYEEYYAYVPGNLYN